ncbi:MAG: hypothetical protein BWZ10_00527 [candidate division BRC1 bacterium ADurb.BinA364]|nr:MAG: hypothetical protein BWZ10_00527 [candidate division BRC1 bacterium ADurb.BinA364]
MWKTFGVIFIAAGFGQSASAAGMAQVGNEALHVELDMQDRAAISAIVDRATGRSFVARSRPPAPLYTIHLGDPNYRRTRVSSEEARDIAAKTGEDGRSLQLTFIHDEPELVVRVRIRAPEGEPLSYWRLDVDNKTSQAIVRVDFPGFAVPQVLGENPDDTVVIFPHANNSQRYWNLPEEFRYAFDLRRQGQGPIQWPFRLCSGYAPDIIQMMAYHDDAAGLYLATYDGTANVKELSVEGLDAAAMRLNIGHIRPWSFGQDFTMGYDTVVGVFHGDWTAAAEMYRQWATRQAWCAKGTLATKDTPDWIKRYPAHLRFVLKHPYRDDPNRTDWDQLLDKLDRFKRDYPDLYPDAMVNLVDFDIGGNWQGFYNERWPAWMGDEAMAEKTREMKRLGLRPSIEPFAWHITNKHEHRQGYILREQPFYRELRQQTLVWSLGNDGTPIDGSSACVASAYGQTVFADDARRAAPWGVDLLQLMEIGLARRMDCYNPNHGHPLGQGPWIFEAVYEAARKTREAGRAVNPDFGTDKEETSEFLIPVLDCMYIRNAQMKNMRWNGRPQLYKNNVPLFDYVYHGYVALIDGLEANSPESMRWCAGIAVALGHLTGPLFSTDPDSQYYRTAQAGGAWDIVVQGKKAYNSYARDYVVFGRVLPSPGVVFEEITQPRQRVMLDQQPGTKEIGQESFVTPQVIQSAHLSPQGGVGLTFVNVSDRSAAFDVDLSRYAAFLKRSDVNVTVRHNGQVIRETPVELSAGKAILRLTVEPRALLFIAM